MWQLCTLGFVQVPLAKRPSREDGQPREDKVFSHLLPHTGAVLVARGHPTRWGRFLCRGARWQDSGQWAQAGTQGVVLKREKSDCCETARGHRLPTEPVELRPGTAPAPERAQPQRGVWGPSLQLHPTPGFASPCPALSAWSLLCSGTSGAAGVWLRSAPCYFF